MYRDWRQPRTSLLIGGLSWLLKVELNEEKKPTTKNNRENLCVQRMSTNRLPMLSEHTHQSEWTNQSHTVLGEIEWWGIVCMVVRSQYARSDWWFLHERCNVISSETNVRHHNLIKYSKRSNVEVTKDLNPCQDFSLLLRQNNCYHQSNKLGHFDI